MTPPYCRSSNGNKFSRNFLGVQFRGNLFDLLTEAGSAECEVTHLEAKLQMFKKI
jgi:hypothetical protein